LGVERLAVVRPTKHTLRVIPLKRRFRGNGTQTAKPPATALPSSPNRCKPVCGRVVEQVHEGVCSRAAKEAYAPRALGERNVYRQVISPANMNIVVATPFERACAKLEQIERELTKSPDFQLYLIVRSPKHRARMERVLMEIPRFRLWRILINSVRRARVMPEAAEDLAC
jgi:hypothetical protein